MGSVDRYPQTVRTIPKPLNSPKPPVTHSNRVSRFAGSEPSIRREFDVWLPCLSPSPIKSSVAEFRLGKRMITH